MTKYSVKKPFTVLVGVILVIVLGAVSFLGLNTDLLPAIDLPYVLVMTNYPGASPEKVETAITKPLEQVLATTNGLENLQSISQENQSIIIMEFSQTINMDSAMIEISGSIDMVKGYFDTSVSSPMLLKLNPDMLPIQVLSVDVDGMDIKTLTKYINDDLVPHFERLDGVATVDVSGTVENYVDITINQSKIDEINDNILKSVNGELYKTKKELKDAKRKLKDGKTELENKQTDAFNKLADGSAQLDAGQAQLMSITSEVEKIGGEIKLYGGQVQMLEGKNQAETGKATFALILQGLEAATAGMTLQTAVGDMQISAILALDSMSIPALAMIQGQLAGVVASGAIGADTTPNQTIGTLTNTIQALEANLISMGVEPAIIAANDSGAINAKITQAQLALKQAEFMKETLRETVAQLQTAYAELEKAKMQAVSAMAMAGAEISSAEKELDKGTKEFENAQDTALKQANIDSLVTQSMINNILQAQNFSMPAGYLKLGEEKITVKVGDKFAQLDEISNLLLVDMKMEGLAPIQLKDVADIAIKDNSEDSFVKVNGNDGIILSFQKSSIASTSEVSDRINKLITELQDEKEGLHITSLMDQGVYIGMVVDSVMQNLLYGGIIAFIVLLLFLKDIRPTLIIGFSIPISLLFAVVLMYFSGITLNIISLSGLALGVGMLVDNSIVVIENTYRLRNLGYSKIRAAVDGAQQVGGAIFASTMTTICVFLPIVFTQGISRQIFTDMGLTIGYSLVASLIVAMTFVPAVSANFLTNTTEQKANLFDKMVKGYEKALRFNLQHKWIVILLTISLLAISGYKALSMPMAFIPPMDSAQMQMTLSMPKQTTQKELKDASEEIAKNAREVKDVKTVAIMDGGAGMMSMGGSSDTKDMSFYVVLEDEKTSTNVEVAQGIKAKTTKYGEQLTIVTDNMDMSALGGSGISVELKGGNFDELQRLATDISGVLKGIEGISTTDDGTDGTLEEMRIDIDKQKAMEHGLTTAQVYQKISEFLKENTTSTTMTFDAEDMQTIISVSEKQTRDTLSLLEMAKETDDDDKETIIALQDIAKIYTATSPKAINRDNQSRTKTVTAELAQGYNVSLVGRDVEDAIKDYKLPSGYYLEVVGENKTITGAMNDLVNMILLAIVFIYLIMVAQFQSLLSPFIVLFTIPLAFTGGLLALQLTGTVLSVVSMIGFLVLAGVVVNNGIVFVDYVNQLRLDGTPKYEALVQAGRDRIRPILMTALTTILAMSTMAMGVGMGADMSQGMAIVTIGGLSYATLLTLFLVPALYDILHRKEMKKIEVNNEV